MSNFAERLHALESRLDDMAQSNAKLEQERDEYKRLVHLFQEQNEKLKRGLLGQKAERLPKNDAQLSLSILQLALGGTEAEDQSADADEGRRERRADNRRAHPQEGGAQTARRALAARDGRDPADRSPAGRPQRIRADRSGDAPCARPTGVERRRRARVPEVRRKGRIRNQPSATVWAKRGRLQASGVGLGHALLRQRGQRHFCTGSIAPNEFGRTGPFAADRSDRLGDCGISRNASLCRLKAASKCQSNGNRPPRCRGRNLMAWVDMSAP